MASAWPAGAAALRCASRLLWVLLLGYGWLVIGFVMLALAAPLELPRSLAWHAFTVGTIGVLTSSMNGGASPRSHPAGRCKPHWLMGSRLRLLNLRRVGACHHHGVMARLLRTAVVTAGMLWSFGVCAVCDDLCGRY